MKILVIGDGTLGKSLAKESVKRGHSVFTTSRKDSSCLSLDLSREVDVTTLPETEWAIIAAAVSGFESCEKDQKAYTVNVTNTINLTHDLMQRGTKILFPSSTAVFNGEEPFYTPTAHPSPQTEYGRQKAEVERFLNKNSGKALVVRYTKILTTESGILYNWLNSFQKQEEITAFTDLSLAPVLIGDAAFATCRLMEENKTGVYHCSSSEEISYYDLAQRLCKHYGFDKRLIKEATCKSNKNMYCPPFSSLNATETENIINWKFPKTPKLIQKLLPPKNSKAKL
ncbi:dTDP-4-dehydrorhamnose reductase [Maridesulfovibrio ferrireducens]|uniref:dTDP-4-dehydrorhamnose reductase n=1 Tax=Maridesulfovibrio ferrireducens TaxID=246191 RepID=A0A1G9B6T0_9BACT|nr:sugar nucleotide-binding protein [Maridesulfovibrio ferrireducens]SDK35193.1 dTDP-4-dehydrorhamnose reductase [Maridesulfovibrio ferrireducens]